MPHLHHPAVRLFLGALIVGQLACSGCSEPPVSPWHCNNGLQMATSPHSIAEGAARRRATWSSPVAVSATRSVRAGCASKGPASPRPAPTGSATPRRPASTAAVRTATPAARTSPAAFRTTASPGACVDGICQPPTCTDGVRNGTETDVDCGGTCASCGTGGGCQSGRRLPERGLRGGHVPGRHLHRRREERRRDGRGLRRRQLRQPATTARGCAVDTDCASGICAPASASRPSCTDGVQNGERDGRGLRRAALRGLRPAGRGCDERRRLPERGLHRRHLQPRPAAPTGSRTATRRTWTAAAAICADLWQRRAAARTGSDCASGVCSSGDLRPPEPAPTG